MMGGTRVWVDMDKIRSIKYTEGEHCPIEITWENGDLDIISADSAPFFLGAWNAKMTLSAKGYVDSLEPSKIDPKAGSVYMENDDLDELPTDADDATIY